LRLQIRWVNRFNLKVTEWYEKERGYLPKSKKHGQTKMGYGFNGGVAPMQSEICTDARPWYRRTAVRLCKKKK